MDIVKACEGNITQFPQQRIVVGVGSARSELRVCVLLKALPDIHYDVICPGCDVDSLIQNADLVIGSRDIALKGVLYKRPVIVVGEYGSGGLLTPENLTVQHDHGFVGRLYGEKNEYFSLEQLKHDLEKCCCLSVQALEYMSNRFKDETLNEDYLNRL